MTEETFTQTSSIINRLRTVMTVIAIFIILCAIALYLSSLSTIQGLQKLKVANDLLTINALMIDNLNTTEKNIDKISVKSNVNDIQYMFDENKKVLSSLFNQSLILSKNNHSVTTLLNEAQITLTQFDFTYRTIIHKVIRQPISMNEKEAYDWNTDLLVAKQLASDAKEILRKVQIAIKQNTDSTFNLIYLNRFKPLAVGVSLSLLFFTFVITFGLSLAKKIGFSISNLLEATDRVAHGDFNYEVKVVERDEIGRLTHAFNNMINNLNIGQKQLSIALDRTARLQAITASFSEALTADQVFDIIFKQAFESLDAITASIALLSDDKNYLEIKRLEGYSQETYERWKKFSVDTDIPVARAVRFRQPIFIEIEKIPGMFKDVGLKDFHPETKYLASLPLVIGSEVLGALTFTFHHSKKIETYEKDYMLALARQCAQAIHRSLLYDDAKKAIEVRDEFLSIASHELRTPLTPLRLQIQGVARQVKKGNTNYLSPERLKKMVETSDRQITRLSTLIDDLLDVSRITSGKLILKKTEFSLKEMINDVTTQYAQQLQDSNTPVNLNVVEDSTGFWDKLRLEQVIINLFTNAAKYAPNRPISITLSKEKNFAKIEVKDMGPGIAEVDQERIFNRFERVSSRENVGGLGLGLYISKQIVEAHRGRIYVRSTLGEGSTFVVELPLGRDEA